MSPEEKKGMPSAWMKERIGKLLRERLPILAVDLLIDGTRAAKSLADRSARLIADGTVPVPGFLLDRARKYVKELDDTDRLAEESEDWEARPFRGEPGGAGSRAGAQPGGEDDLGAAETPGEPDSGAPMAKAVGRGPAVWGKAIDKLKGGKKKKKVARKPGKAGKAKPGRKGG